MIIGSHNSLTYAKPKHWWGYLAIPFARCQNINLVNQYKHGIRCFDIRVRPSNDSDYLEFGHGIMSISETLINDINKVYSMSISDKEKVYIRLILEDIYSDKNKEKNEQWFIDFALSFENNYPFFIFFEGRRKSDWKKLVNFKSGYEPRLEQNVSSISETARWYEKLIPWFYAKRTNDTFKPDKNSDIILYDFIK